MLFISLHFRECLDGFDCVCGVRDVMAYLHRLIKAYYPGVSIFEKRP